MVMERHHFITFGFDVQRQIFVYWGALNRADYWASAGARIGRPPRTRGAQNLTRCRCARLEVRWSHTENTDSHRCPTDRERPAAPESPRTSRELFSHTGVSVCRHPSSTKSTMPTMPTNLAPKPKDNRCASVGGSSISSTSSSSSQGRPCGTALAPLLHHPHLHVEEAARRVRRPP